MQLKRTPVLTRLSHGRHSLLAVILQSSKSSSSLWPVIHLIDGLQVLYLICGPRVQLMWDITVWKYLLAVGKALSWRDAGYQGQAALTIAAAGAFWLILIAVLSWLHVPQEGNQHPSNGIVNLMVRLLLGYIVLLQSGLLTYLFEATFSDMFCTEGDCSDAGRRYSPISVTISAVLLVIQGWLLHPATIEINPFSVGGACQFYSRVTLWRPISRISIAFLYYLMIGVNLVPHDRLR
jgi:hypothetical protein